MTCWSFCSYYKLDKCYLRIAKVQFECTDVEYISAQNGREKSYNLCTIHVCKTE